MDFYFWANLIYLIGYYLVGCRKNRYPKSQKKSYPDKIDQYINEITIKFHLYFADLAVETLEAFQNSRRNNPETTKIRIVAAQKMETRKARTDFIEAIQNSIAGCKLKIPGYIGSLLIKRDLP